MGQMICLMKLLPSRTRQVNTLRYNFRVPCPLTFLVQMAFASLSFDI